MALILKSVERIFFRRISASGWGLMRIAWAATVLVFFIFKSRDITRYFSDTGIFPMSLANDVMRAEYHFTIFQYITHPIAVYVTYMFFLSSLVCMILGLFPRLSTIISVLLLLSFHERNYLMLGGGDTVFRAIGFLLMISPGIEAFSVKRFDKQWLNWKKTSKLLPPVTMSSWPVVLLLVQIVIVYVYSGWTKALGDMWITGTALGVILHHPDFARFMEVIPDSVYNTLSPFFSRATVIWEFTWLFLLIPTPLFDRLLVPSKNTFRRVMLVLGVLFHISIFILMDVGSFSPAMLVAYLGLLTADDFELLKRFANGIRRTTQKIVILYDGHCGLCKRSIFTLQLLDHLKRVRPIDFHNNIQREKVAPTLTFAQLDRSMHIKLPNGRFLDGFYAFRALSWHLPTCWLIAPLLYIPPVPFFGKKVYAQVAKRRLRCTHESCSI